MQPQRHQICNEVALCCFSALRVYAGEGARNFFFKTLVGLRGLAETYNARGPLTAFEVPASVSIRSSEKDFLCFGGAEGRFPEFQLLRTVTSDPGINLSLSKLFPRSSMAPPLQTFPADRRLRT